MIQAMSGLMSITGFPTNGPTRVGFAGADVMSGFTAAFGVASALYQRTHTGKGQLVDVAMIDAVTGFLAQQFTEHMMTGRVHEQAQNLSVTRKPTGNLFKTKDGWMVLAVMTDPQFQRLMKVLGCEAALPDPRFKDWPTRIANNTALHEIVEAAMKKETSATWAEKFAKADVPAGRVLSIPETVKLDHYGHRTIMQTIVTEHGPIKVVGSGFRMEHDGGSIERPPATIGQHTDEVLREAGYSAAEIAEMRAAKVI
jgi:crotonobetainyl-CoA:carnitine CoA-transferase CaiB-like acyl-CoA transferase